MGIVLYKRLKELTSEEKRELLERGLKLERVLAYVKEIVDRVKLKGDRALLDYEKKFDEVELTAEELVVHREEFEEAWSETPTKVIEALEKAQDRVRTYQGKLLPEERKWLSDEVNIEVEWRPIERVGVYVPGGRAAYPSTVIMNVVPAQVAGVREIVLCTPPMRKQKKVNPAILAAAQLLGVERVYKVGGAQAIAAMAYGTETIPKVDKVVGPGNIYVTAAKYLVSREVGIDMLAGPSELLIIAGEHSNPEWLSLDLAAQAEHDPEAQAVLVTTSRKLAERVAERCRELLSQVAGKIVVLIADNLEEAIEFTNEYAPEHLAVVEVEEERGLLNNIKNAGTVFIGEYTAPALGDYILGANHVLPTSGGARWRGELTVYDFLKPVTVQRVSAKALKELGEAAEILAEAEGLKWHASSIRARRQ